MRTAARQNSLQQLIVQTPRLDLTDSASKLLANDQIVKSDAIRPLDYICRQMKNFESQWSFDCCTKSDYNGLHKLHLRS